MQKLYKLITKMFAGYQDNKNHECVKDTHSSHSLTMTKYLWLNYEKTSEIETLKSVDTCT